MKWISKDINKKLYTCYNVAYTFHRQMVKGNFKMDICIVTCCKIITVEVRASIWIGSGTVAPRHTIFSVPPFAHLYTSSVQEKESMKTFFAVF